MKEKSIIFQSQDLDGEVIEEQNVTVLTDRYNEASIYVNGKHLNNAQAMTVRVALNCFCMDLNNDGLGDDKHGKKMTELYLARIGEIMKCMLHKNGGKGD